MRNLAQKQQNMNPSVSATPFSGPLAFWFAAAGTLELSANCRLIV